MPAIKVGLAPRKTSYFDPLTNTYLTLENPVQTINFDDNTDLSKITHAVCCQPPALVLYEGNIPQSFIDAWKAKFNIVGKGAHKRADAVNAKSADVVTASVGQQADLFSLSQNDEAAKKAAEEEAARKAAEEEAAKKAAEEEAAKKAEEEAAAKAAEAAAKASAESGKGGKGKDK